jgi:hypothetical protein
MDALQALKLALKLERWRRRRRKHAMANEQVPDGLVLFENYIDFVIADNGHYVYAALSKNRGCVVFNVDKLLYEIPGSDDWGAPSIEWRPTDGQCIVVSVHQGGTGFLVSAVPGVYKDGRVP